MVLAFLNLSPSEITIALVVAVVVFGRRLPEVAGQAAAAVARMRRSMDELRRETGIDREIRNARRAVQEAVPRDLGRAATLGQEAPPPQPTEAPATPESGAGGEDAVPPTSAQGEDARRGERD